MTRSKWLGKVAVVLLALASFTPALQAQTVVQTQLGGTFNGTIADTGSWVEARFMAVPGPDVTIVIEAVMGSSLQPSVVIRDPNGVVVDAGTTRHIRWLPVGNLIRDFPVTMVGQYTAVIAAEAGHGGFMGRLSGSPADIPTSTVSGTVTDSVTNAPIAGVDVSVDDVSSATTNADGEYAIELMAGSYAMTFEVAGYETGNRLLVVTGGASTVADIALVSIAMPVGIEIVITGDAMPGAALDALVELTGATLTSVAWTQLSGVPVTFGTPDQATTTVTLGTTIVYKGQLIETLSEPPIGEDQLPPNVPLPEGEFPGGLQDRFQVVGVNPFSLEEAALVVLEVEVVTDRGTFHEEAEIHATLPWIVSSGLNNVPMGSVVLLHGKSATNGGTYDWALTPPSQSSATLMDPTTQNPYFTPDVSGTYEIAVTDSVAGTPVTLWVYAGTWRGTIIGQDMDGRPVSDTACTFCHSGGFAPDMFTPWMQTGHAEIFTNNLNTSTHYGPSCFPCHTVGYDPDANNNGVDDASDYQDFLDAGLINNPGDNWTTVLDLFPNTARLANIQCENCHGPQDSVAHGFAGPIGEPRVDLSSDVCATCHGEPLRHARFQQWQLSAHANYELAIDEGDSGNCSRCHTSNGFLAWLPEADADTNVTVTWEVEETHPQTCVTCHDPHNVGTISGNNTNAPVRIYGDSPVLAAGFQATDVGSGAICITCHNTRRGLRNDDVWDGLSVSDRSRAPHGAAQADVLMGQNAYFTSVGTPGGHGADIEDTCVDCHMQATPPPGDLSYNSGGTNHTFYAAKSICSECHSPHLKAEDVQDGIDALLHQVEALIVDTSMALISDALDSGYTVDFDGVVITDIAAVEQLGLGERRGRMALILTTGGVTLDPVAVTSIEVNDNGTVLGSLWEFGDDSLWKAGWNYFLFHNDGSLGVHNPFFASNTLIAARNAIVAAAGNRSPASMRLWLTRPGRQLPTTERPTWREFKSNRDER